MSNLFSFAFIEKERYTSKWPPLRILAVSNLTSSTVLLAFGISSVPSAILMMMSGAYLLVTTSILYSFRPKMKCDILLNSDFFGEAFLVEWNNSILQKRGMVPVFLALLVPSTRNEIIANRWLKRSIPGAVRVETAIDYYHLTMMAKRGDPVLCTIWFRNSAAAVEFRLRYNDEVVFV